MDTYGFEIDGELVAVAQHSSIELAQGWFRAEGARHGRGAKLIVLDLGEGEKARVGNRLSVDSKGVALIVEPTISAIFEDVDGKCRPATLLSNGEELCETDGNPVERTEEVRGSTGRRVYRRQGTGCYLVDEST